jgi:mRNA interferase MazF
VGAFTAGDVVLVRFPFSDLSQTKLRPAIVLADAGRGDLVLCQVTSRPYGDAAAEPLAPAAFLRGRLPVDSYVRPAKLFTAHADLVAAVVGTLRDDARERVVSAVVQVLRTGGMTERR